MKKTTPAASEKTNPIQTQYKPNFKGGIIIKNMNIEVEDPAFRGRNQTQSVVSLPALPVLSLRILSYVEVVEGVEPISKSKKCCRVRRLTAKKSTIKNMDLNGRGFHKKNISDLKLSLISLSTILKMLFSHNLCEPAQVLDRQVAGPDNLLGLIKS